MARAQRVTEGEKNQMLERVVAGFHARHTQPATDNTPRLRRTQKSDVTFPPSDEGGGFAAKNSPQSRRERQNQMPARLYAV